MVPAPFFFPLSLVNLHISVDRNLLVSARIVRVFKYLKPAVIYYSVDSRVCLIGPLQIICEKKMT